jgi:hypothetical protein
MAFWRGMIRGLLFRGRGRSEFFILFVFTFVFVFVGFIAGFIVCEE